MNFWRENLFVFDVVAEISAANRKPSRSMFQFNRANTVDGSEILHQLVHN